MANVGAIGSVIFTNQMTPLATDLQNGVNNRVEFQNMIAQATANEKQKEVEDIRPSEENQGVNPDHEHQREEADEETKIHHKVQKRKRDEASSTMEHVLHKLDIKV